MISIVKDETEKSLAQELRRKAPRFTSLFPLALLGGLLTKTHYKTFFLLQNHEDSELVRDDESVTDGLKSTYRKRKFKFLKQYEMWNLYKGNKVKTLKSENKAELQVCLDILIKSNILGRWETGKTKIYIMNPWLVYISPNKKYDSEWEKVINSLFDLGDCSNELE